MKDRCGHCGKVFGHTSNCTKFPKSVLPPYVPAFFNAAGFLQADWRPHVLKRTIADVKRLIGRKQ